MLLDEFGALDVLKTNHGVYAFYRLSRLEEKGLANLHRLPFSIKVLLEAALRQCNQAGITAQDVLHLANWQPQQAQRPSIPFLPVRVLMQDFTGVPAIVDLTAMRSALARLGGDPRRINPLVPVDLVIDHSVQVDFFASPDALQRNAEMEFLRNRERYEFLRWGQNAFENFRVVPPATGIVHQVNLEYLAQVVFVKEMDGKLLVFPDSLVGTDSHTTMINGLGVLGWGVGGIEAEAVMLGQPMDMLIPDVVGFKLHGELSPGVTATDLTLTITQMLRQKGVVGKFVEFYGPGLEQLSLPDRATIANMAPEYGATVGFFPVDEETLNYLRQTARSEELIERVEVYCKEQGLFRTTDTPEPHFSETLELDLSTVETSLAGPKRPQDRLSLKEVKPKFQAVLAAPRKDNGFEIPAQEVSKSVSLTINGNPIEIGHGSVVIAAITSCTNTSNPSVMIAAGLLAKKAIERGLRTAPHVKTSLAPGSRVVTEYLEKAGLLEPLSQLGFNVVAYGCTTCIGNSGPLAGELVKAITDANLVVAAVLSGNRNFEGRIHPYVRAAFLASPPLVVAYALAGTVNIDFINEPLGKDSHGNPVYLHEVFPAPAEVQQVISQVLSPQLFKEKYADVFTGNPIWNSIQTRSDALYPWDPQSTYIQEPPFFLDLSPQVPSIKPIMGARVLVMLGDSVTTDHISPAGAIPLDSPAGKYLLERGVSIREFNSYGSRRGNDQVMTRGTFANIRLKNRLAQGREGGYTLYFGAEGEEGVLITIYEAAMKYREQGIPLLVLAGKEYGSGSSRDWAAKGTALLGVRAVIAESFERIHRSNLVGMGVLPLQFEDGENIDALGLDGKECYFIEGLHDDLLPRSKVKVRAVKKDGKEIIFQAIARLDTPTEVEYYRNGGILQTVLRRFL